MAELFPSGDEATSVVPSLKAFVYRRDQYLTCCRVNQVVDLWLDNRPVAVFFCAAVCGDL